MRQTVLNGSEDWMVRQKNRTEYKRSGNMKMLMRWICGVTREDRIRNKI